VGLDCQATPTEVTALVGLRQWSVSVPDGGHDRVGCRDDPDSKDSVASRGSSVAGTFADPRDLMATQGRCTPQAVIPAVPRPSRWSRARLAAGRSRSKRRQLAARIAAAFHSLTVSATTSQIRLLRVANYL